jgi:hypothetical protein
MPTTPPTATQLCDDPSLASGEACSEVRPTTNAPTVTAHADWWGDALDLWTRRPQGAGPRVENPVLNTH